MFTVSLKYYTGNLQTLQCETVSLFCTMFAGHIFRSRKRKYFASSARYARKRKHTHVIIYSIGYYRLILTKTGISWLILTKFSNLKFHENPFGGSYSYYADRHGEANRGFFIAFRWEKAKKKYIYIWFESQNPPPDNIHLTIRILWHM
jgi:hypothetical protein